MPAPKHPIPEHGQKPSIDSLLAAAKPAERTVPMCTRPDLQADFDELERRLQAEQQASDGMFVAGAEKRRLAEEIEALRAEMSQSVVEFRLRALPRRQWRALVRDSPPADGKGEFDPDVLFPKLIRASVVDPEISDEQWQTLLGDDDVDGSLSSSQFDALATAAWNLNRQDPRVPFSRLASVVLRGSEQT